MANYIDKPESVITSASATCYGASPSIAELRQNQDVKISEAVRLQYGEPVENDGECDQCFAKGLPVWASLNIDGDWIGLCARCINENNAP